MASLDIFTGDAFSVQSLTLAINETPFTPMRISRLGLFNESGISTTSLSIEKKGTTLSLIPNTARGSSGQVKTNDKARLVPIATTHLPQRGAVNADEVQNLRAFGTESEVETVQNLVNRKLAKMRQDLDVTIEWQRIGALKGLVLDADGTTPILDVFNTFGETQQVKPMVLDNSATKVKTKIIEAKRLVEDVLGGIMYTGFHAFCGTAFFDTLVSHAAVEKAYDRWMESMFLRTDQRGQEGTGPGFDFVGVRWEEYRGQVSGQSFIAPDEAYLVPLGIRDMFVTNYAPADYMETVNTTGLPYYAKQELMRMGKGVELEAQSNPINFCTRPGAVIKLKLGNA